MNATAIAMLQRLDDLGLADGPVAQTRADFVAALGVSPDAVKRGNAALKASGIVTVNDRPGHPCEYRRTMPPDPRPTPPPDPPLGRAPDPRSEPPSHASVPETTSSSNPLDGNRRCQAREEESGARPPDRPTPARPPDPPAVVEVGQAVVGWAVDEQRRLGKPPLDGAMLGRLGSVAKRMLAGGVSVEELKAAAEHLVARDMSDLQAAHRQAQAATSTSPPVDGGSSYRGRPGDVAALTAAAAASRAARQAKGLKAPESLGWHEPGEIVEVMALVAETWQRVYPKEIVDRWQHELRMFPVPCLLASVKEYARRGESYPPNWGEVYAIARPMLSRAIEDWKRGAVREAE